MARRIDLSAPAEVEVRIPDPASDAVRKFSLRLMTRSVKRQIVAANAKLDEANAALPDEGAATPEQEEAVMRAACDLISVLLSSGEDSPEAGDLLYDAWFEDRITDDQILGLMESLAGVEADPT